ncbi:MAG: CPBP family intramembrane metalloprotease [Candidatus Thermoplasmatota archaeon]|nr:CPBP family intramembrane metalloprotease [Candidatus Thermoplasmatota archaeon]
MQFDFFLWPMLVPLIIPLFYTLIYKKKSILDVALIVLIMVLIVIFYWPLTMVLSTSSNIITKFLLFIALPLIVLYISWRLLNNKKDFTFDRFGITNNGIEKSLKLGFLFIPLMLFVTFIAKYLIGGVNEPHFFLGVVSFVESFTEEFFFRGILFLYLSSKINLKIAYITSLLSFILMHPQNLTNPFIISTIVQGVLTLEICRRSKNLAGAWVLHGTNRFFSIVILPLFF